MAEDNVTAADARHSQSTDRPKTHPAILALAWLIGRGMARERFANATDAKHPQISRNQGRTTGRKSLRRQFRHQLDREHCS